MTKQPAPLGTVLREDYEASVIELAGKLQSAEEERDEALAALTNSEEEAGNAEAVVDKLAKELSEALAALREIADLDDSVPWMGKAPGRIARSALSNQEKSERKADG